MDIEPTQAKEKNLDLRLLHQFVEICGQPTLAAAAAALGVSKPAISQIVTRLESELGVALFERGRSGLRLLPAGRRLLELAQTIIADERTALAEMRSFRSHPIPRLRVYVMESISPIVAPALYEALSEQVGSISIESGRSGTCVNEFLRGDIDILVSTELFEDMAASVDVHLLCSQDLCLVAPHAFAGAGSSLAELAEELPLVRAPENTRMHAAIARYLAICGVTPRRELACRSVGATIEIVRAGRGWTLLPPLAMSAHRDFLDVISIIPLPGRPPAQTIALAADRDRFLETPAAIALACRGALQERLRQVASGRSASALGAVRVY
ncbi:MAG: LysR family transcriptional regulator [Microvirga sp.]|nr:LysR family transcriptional regulator [Microvirga sp.]